MGQRKRGRGWIDTPSGWAGSSMGLQKPIVADRYSLGLWCRGCGHPVADSDFNALVLAGSAWHRGCPREVRRAVPIEKVGAASGICHGCQIALPSTGRCDTCG